jgi:hypothetical protein
MLMRVNSEKSLKVRDAAEWRCEKYSVDCIYDIPLADHLIGY